MATISEDQLAKMLKDNPELVLLTQDSSPPQRPSTPSRRADRSASPPVSPDDDADSFNQDVNSATIVLRNERPQSWNAYWAGTHWSERSANAGRVHRRMRDILEGNCKMFTVPVNITYRVYFAHHPQDASNVCIKPYEDGLIGLLIKDDSMQFVASTTTVPLVDATHPRIEIKVTAV